MKKLICNWLNKDKKVTWFIYGLIILNVIALILESYESIDLKYSLFFWYFEVISLCVFSIEYIARVYSYNAYGEPRRDFLFSFYGIIDALAIIPFCLPFLISFDLRIIRILRLFRLIRVFKFGRLSKSFNTIKEVLINTKTEMFMTMSMALVLLLISSTLMYYAESEVQPDKFKSIGHSFWWAIATLTTVGYGDIYPITTLGKILSSVIAIIGIGFVALPTGILSSAFMDHLKSNKDESCPHCGEKLLQSPLN